MAAPCFVLARIAAGIGRLVLAGNVILGDRRRVAAILRLRSRIAVPCGASEGCVAVIARLARERSFAVSDQLFAVGARLAGGVGAIHVVPACAIGLSLTLLGKQGRWRKRKRSRGKEK